MVELYPYFCFGYIIFPTTVPFSYHNTILVVFQVKQMRQQNYLGRDRNK